jgi:CRISPR-associated endonuclease/helicase Cas3
MTADRWLHGALGLKEGETPFPWQSELVSRFLRGQIDRALDIPTGLGKTAVMAAWLVARGRGAPIPRRLVYVVDRRAVVDQATKFAESLRSYVDANADIKAGLGLDTRALPISTLRGQYVDNREWLEDPAAPAIIVGTVDMIGSRLLFEGYGVSRKMRPYHAGLLGADTLIVLDEAHLVPPFEMLIESIATDRDNFRPEEENTRHVPTLALLALSATGRPNSSVSFGLTEADLEHPVVKERLAARKRVTTVLLAERALPDVLAEHAWRLTRDGERPIRGVIYCNRRKDAEQTRVALAKLAGDRAAVELFVGERRVFERGEAAQWLESHGFLGGSSLERAKPTIVVATSAGEVGVDLDADHMVCDLVTWERMVQRLGRVNRRGKGDAEVIVVLEPEPKPDKATAAALDKDEDDRDDDARDAIARHESSVAQALALRDALAQLPEHDASPGALRAMKLRAVRDPVLRGILDAATSAAPLRPALTRPVVDAWSMTSLVDDPSRPQIAPWLRGWVDDEPQTTVVWRTYLPARRGVRSSEVDGFFEAAPPHVDETLEAPTYTVVEWLIARAHAVRRQHIVDDDSVKHPLLDNIVAIILSSADELRDTRTLQQLDLEFVADKKVAKRSQEDLGRLLVNSTLVVDARLGGLRVGLLDPKFDDIPPTADRDHWASTGFRVYLEQSERESERGWSESFRFVLDTTANGEASQWLLVENASTEEERSKGHPQLLTEHQDWTRRRAQDIAKALSLPSDLEQALTIAARLHDEGKRAHRWQRAFRAKRDGIYAKTRGPIDVALLDGYRHELGSLPYAYRDPEVMALPEELRDLVLHLIAAHHGNARPVITTSGCEDAPPSALEDRAREIALRFIRLQRRWGPWGLAWLETLLRSADQMASKENDKRGTT